MKPSWIHTSEHRLCSSKCAFQKSEGKWLVGFFPRSGSSPAGSHADSAISYFACTNARASVARWVGLKVHKIMLKSSCFEKKVHVHKILLDPCNFFFLDMYFSFFWIITLINLNITIHTLYISQD